MHMRRAFVGGLVASLVMLLGAVGARATELVDADQALVTATSAMTFTTALGTASCNVTLSLGFIHSGGADAMTGLERLGAVGAGQASGCTGLVTSMSFPGIPTALGGRPANPGSGLPAWTLWVLLPQPLNRSANLFVRSPQISVVTPLATCLYGAATLLGNIPAASRTLTFTGTTVSLVSGGGFCSPTARIAGVATTSAPLTFTHAAMLGAGPDPLNFNGVAGTLQATYTNLGARTKVLARNPDPGEHFNVNNGCEIAAIQTGRSCVVDVHYDGTAGATATLKFMDTAGTLLDTIDLIG